MTRKRLRLRSQKNTRIYTVQKTLRSLSCEFGIKSILLQKQPQHYWTYPEKSIVEGHSLTIFGNR